MYKFPIKNDTNFLTHYFINLVHESRFLPPEAIARFICKNVRAIVLTQCIYIIILYEKVWAIFSKPPIYILAYLGFDANLYCIGYKPNKKKVITVQQL